MADAVADEIDDLKSSITAEVESKMNMVMNRIQNAQLSADKTENEQAKLKFNLDRLSQEVAMKLSANGASEH